MIIFVVDLATRSAFRNLICFLVPILDKCRLAPDNLQAEASGDVYVMYSNGIKTRPRWDIGIVLNLSQSPLLILQLSPYNLRG